ncbi:hypothetical protein ADUPG1_009878 [Aduncisulcus paluster]|uniref:Uncharacterized protein n=1 Tax=Aduncisulcus paluster TaxID=2918883 RepID=A0ABQ5KX36_9EUKA|nr:hypothetical protein ADUPG1_009878 [Aduncisulcus paluster]
MDKYPKKKITFIINTSFQLSSRKQVVVNVMRDVPMRVVARLAAEKLEIAKDQELKIVSEESGSLEIAKDQELKIVSEESGSVAGTITAESALYRYGAILSIFPETIV